MELKNYQQNTLNILQKFFEDCRIVGAVEAYKKTINNPEIAFRLGKLRSDYCVWNTIPFVPRVCLKIPTGGGKTIIAAHAIKIASQTLLEREYPVVLWFCPSDTIRRQTAEALKNPRHPYRQVLDEQFGGRVRIFDIDEKFAIRPADIDGNTCIIASTIQSFKQSNTDKYNVYKDNENLEPHFTRIKTMAAMEIEEKEQCVKYSFANLLNFHRPIVIVDEAHNAVSDLTQDTHGRLNPSAIIELTATPQLNNNTLYNVRASELKEEEMIKLPIVLVEHRGWENAVDEAVARRAALEKAAQDETDYVRPIILFQAQDKNGEVTVETLKNYLLETANLPLSEIAVVTGGQHELDGINIFDRACPIKYIITVEALKEGWDCSFAYVLCSLANVKSDTSVEQLLGRVMRMPYARTRKNSVLNKAYAFVLSKSFGESAQALVEKLVHKGFDDDEAESALEQLPVGELFYNSGANKVKLTTKLDIAGIPSSIKFDKNTKEIEWTTNTTEADIDKICEQVGENEKFEIKSKFSYYKKYKEAPSPAKLGEKFSIPKLLLEIQGEFVFADPDIIFESFDWDIAEFAAPKLESNEFNIAPQGKNFLLDIDKNKFSHSFVSEAQMALNFAEVENWTVANLVSWLDRNAKQEDISQGKMLEWLRKIIDYLTEMRKIKLSELTIAKYDLKNKIMAKIAAARDDARKKAWQESLFERKSRIKLDFNTAFEFNESMYEGEIFQQSRYKFNKHYLGAYKVARIDGGESGEEFQCAKAIDSLTEVKFWIRNIARHQNSFKLPTSTDNFYPDFAALLNDGRILIIEYKGGHLITADDTKEKAMIGELWEKQMDGKGLFMLAQKSIDGLNISEQIKVKIGA
ncbi:MAG: DEAD/DEAH box helicase family protein [Elusimicrobiota bacterium]|jgi:type III restriction enzyme|nr:DEAD/DEAH box helicase family protein [Elusimicrobiota bacterium]